MNNPWIDIDLNSYENHMSLENVRQLQTMNQMMKEQFSVYDVESIMVLGIAGGNGLEHIDRKKIKCVYGVDINPEYLNECSKRYNALDSIFKPVCADLSGAVPTVSLRWRLLHGSHGRAGWLRPLSGGVPGAVL